MTEGSDKNRFSTGAGLDALAGISQAQAEELVGQAVGDYRITGLVAEGGMGRVYRAERVDGSFEREVAIKISATSGVSDQVRAQFLREQATLAQLNHPNITQLYDARVSDDGWPYIVMEFVDGEAIDEWAREKSLEENVERLIEVVDAVAYAHARLILHRDIKPSNVYVDREGHAKLLDFGIAKLLEQESGALTQAAPMTPDYASPEQLLRQPVTVASDIFQLGLLIHEVLTGRRVRRSDSIAEAIRNAAEARPLLIDSDARSDLPRELTLVIEQCLRSSADDRYRDAGALADDLRAWLAGFPVSAAGQNAWYRARKFARRNLAAVSIALAAVAVIAASTTWYVSEVTAQRDLAEQQYNLATESLDFLFSFFEAANPYGTDGETLTARDILEQGAERVMTELDDQPAIQESLLYEIAVLYFRLGQLDEAERYTKKTLEVRAEFYEGRERERLLLGTRNLLALIYEGRGEYDRAEAIYDEIIEVGLEEFGFDDIIVQEAIENRGYILYVTGRLDEALVMLEDMYAYKLETLGPESADTLGSAVNVAFMRTAVGQYEEALEIAEANLPIAERVLGEYDYVTISMLQSVASAYFELGRHDAAHPLLEEHLRRMVHIHGEDSPEVLEPRMNFGRSLAEIGELEQAESELRAVVDDLVAEHGEEHLTTLQAKLNLAATLIERGNAEEGREILDALIPRMGSVVGDTHPETLYARVTYANALAALDDPGTLDYCKRLLPRLVAELGDEHRYTRELKDLIASADATALP